MYIEIFIYITVVFRLLVFFFFFQAEDGIRDLTVTGVQTCALPIFPHPRRLPLAVLQRDGVLHGRRTAARRRGAAARTADPRDDDGDQPAVLALGVDRKSVV